MMEEEYDFDKVGKRMPYKVPVDFFDTITEKTLAAAESRARSKQRQIPELWRVLSVAASVAALLLVGYFLYTDHSGNPQKERVVAEAAQPNAATADSVTLSSPPPAVASQAEPQPVPDVKAAKVPATRQKQQLAQARESETLDEILTSITDQELLQLTAMASAEEYVVDQTFYE